MMFVTVGRDTGGEEAATQDTGQSRTRCLRIGEGCESSSCIARTRGMRLFASKHFARSSEISLGSAAPVLELHRAFVMCPSLRGIAPGRPMASPARAACAKRRSSASVRT